MAAPSTKDRLLEAGIQMLLERGYNDLGIAALLEETKTPKGSFYHHFKSKEDFALQAVDLYMVNVHAALDAFLGDKNVAPLDRIRAFFEATESSYRGQGYLGCLLGGLGQELSGVSEVFRARVEECFTQIGDRLGEALVEARRKGDLPKKTDCKKLAELLVNCWEGAALRTRLRRDPKPLKEMLDFYFRVATT